MRVAGLNVDIPNEWEDHSLYTFVAPPEDVSPALAPKGSNFRKNVVFQQRRLDKEETLDDCVDKAVANTEQMFGDVEIVVADGPSTDAFNSRRLTYTVIDDVTNQPVAQVIYLCLLDRTEWQVAFSAAAITLSEALESFDRIVASIRPA